MAMVPKEYACVDFTQVFLYYLKFNVLGHMGEEFEMHASNVPHLDSDENHAVQSFIRTGMMIVKEAYMPVIYGFMIEAAYQFALRNDLSYTQIRLLALAKHLAMCCYTNDYDAIIDTASIWSPDVDVYAYTTFYKKLPSEVLERYSIELLF